MNKKPQPEHLSWKSCGAKKCAFQICKQGINCAAEKADIKLLYVDLPLTKRHIKKVREKMHDKNQKDVLLWKPNMWMWSGVC